MMEILHGCVIVERNHFAIGAAEDARIAQVICFPVFGAKVITQDKWFVLGLSSISAVSSHHLALCPVSEDRTKPSVLGGGYGWRISVS